MDIVSIAIWNGNKFVMAVAAGVWLANVGFSIHSKPLPKRSPLLHMIGNLIQICDGIRCHAGK